jgi:hypothetical protein
MIRTLQFAAAVMVFLPAAGIWADDLSIKDQLQNHDAPNGTSTATTYVSKVSVETSTDKSTATLDLSDRLYSNQAGDYYNLAFSAKAPFDSSKSDTLDLGDLSGLTAGTQAHLALSWSRWTPITAQGVQDIEALQKSSYIAQLYGAYPWKTAHSDEGPTLQDAVSNAKLEPTPLSLIKDQASYLQIVAELNKLIAAYNQANPGKPKLVPVKPNSDFKELAAAAKESYLGTVVRYAPPSIPSIALSLDGNNQSFSWVTPQAPTKINKEGKNGVGASIVATELGTNWLASVSFGYTRSYMAQPQGQICSPISGSTSTNCVTASLGQPKKTTGRIISVEFRDRIFASLAVSPQVQYSEVDSKWAVKLPIYVVADATKVLNGGVTLGWTTADHFGAAIFIGKAFSFR